MNVPQLKVDVDRAKAQQLGVDTPAVFGTLQAFLGSYYVNDFNFLGRVYQVRMQADGKSAPSRMTSDSCTFAASPARWCHSRR